MSIFWTVPLALAGIALVALPIAVHLLVRHQVRTLAYPSLRFLRETQLAALRRHRIEDWALLICRCAIVALAAIALAGPVLQTASRTAEQSGRVSRAIVTLGAVSPDVTAPLMEGAFASTTIGRTSVADGVADAIRWLAAQPRSAREIVIAGELRRGLIAATDLASVPPDVGIRFEQTANDLAAVTTLTTLERRNGTLVRVEQAVTLGVDSTRVGEGAQSPVTQDLVTVIASARDAVLADAALRAALDAGVPWNDFDRRVVVAWEGADETAVKARSTSASVVRMPVPSPQAQAADAVRSALVKASGVSWTEPMAIMRSQLDAWSRPAGGPSDTAPVADEGDRRWIWALILALLAIEAWLRRPAKTAESRPNEEARVA